jgi:hypothetical protein
MSLAHTVALARRSLLFSGAGLVLWCGPAVAGKYAGEFLELGVGARGLGMGQAMTAVTDDAYSFYWNPAGLALVNRRALSGMAASSFGDLGDPLANTFQAGFTMPVGLANLALNYLRFSVTDIPRYPAYPDAAYSFAERRRLIEENGGLPEGSFEDVEQALFFSFAKLNLVTLNFGWLYREIPLRIPVGANFKLIQNELDGQQATGIGADAGVQLQFLLDDLITLSGLGELCLAARFENFTNTGLEWQVGEDAINYNHVFGFAWKRRFQDLGVTLSRDIDHRYETLHRTGLEVDWKQRVRLRTGMLGREDRWTYGAGFLLKDVSVDYAGFDHDLGRVHRLSLVFHL